MAAEGSRFAANAETDVLVRGIAVGTEQWLNNSVLPLLGQEIRAQADAERGRLAERMLTDLLAVVRTPAAPESGAEK